jgi:hypothetical protein
MPNKSEMIYFKKKNRNCERNIFVPVALERMNIPVLGGSK